MLKGAVTSLQNLFRATDNQDKRLPWAKTGHSHFSQIAWNDDKYPAIASRPRPGQSAINAAEIGASVTLAARLPRTHSARASSVIAFVRPTKITASF